MRFFRRIFLPALAMLSVAAETASGHCQTPPQVEMSYPAPGMSVQKATYLDFGGYVQIDTFYQKDLRDELTAKFQAVNHVVFGFVDSIYSRVVVDTFMFDTVKYEDTTRTETVWISIQSQLKGSLPVQKLSFQIPKLLYYYSNPLYYTYAGLIDTPFVAFFNTYNTTQEFGVGPEDGCFVEPRAYLMIHGRIHKKGQEGYRRPGISVPASEFAQAAGVDMRGITVPFERPHPAALRFNGSSLSIVRRGEPWNYTAFDAGGSRFPYSRVLEPYGVALYDLSGRRLAGFHAGNALDFSAHVRGYSAAAGLYLLRVSGGNWDHSKRLMMSGKSGVRDTVDVHR